MSKTKPLADIKRRMLKIVDELNDMAVRTPNKARAHKLGTAADLVTESAACELWRMR